MRGGNGTAIFAAQAVMIIRFRGNALARGQALKNTTKNAVATCCRWFLF